MDMIPPNKDLLIEAIEETGFLRVKVHAGAFLRKAAQAFTQVTDMAISEGKTILLVDFSHCEYISSEGLGCVAALWHRCHDEGQGTMITLLKSDAGNELNYLFDIIGLTRLMDGFVFTELKDAQNKVNGFIKGS